jgi:uncharacterized membrane protein YdbT with pleckstrin-like domain
MESRPHWLVIVFWMRRFVYVAVVFTLVVFGAIFIDGPPFNIWQGLIVGNVGLINILLGISWLLFILPALFWNVLRWMTTIHTLAEKEFIFSKGVLNKKKYVVNYEHIENINVVRTLPERILGISTLRVETAGTRPGESELEIEGLMSNDAERLVREISRTVELAKEREKEKIQKVTVEKPDPGLEDLKEYSKMMIKELKEIRDLLAAERKKKIWEAKED